MTKVLYRIIGLSVVLVMTLFLFSSCKLHSMISDNEFVKQNNVSNEINGTYTINQNFNDGLGSYSIHVNTDFYISDMIHYKDQEMLKDRKIESLTISYDGKNRITFSLFDGNENFNFIYKCKSKGNYLEIYFTKTRIWALPLFLNYQYDRLRLGLDKNSNLIVHKWRIHLATLTIMPFDVWGNKDYSHVLIRL